MSLVFILFAVAASLQAPDTLHLIESQRVPGDGSNYFFDEIVDLAVDPVGAVFVLLPNQQSVAKFDATGQFELMMGRAGSGPGEFRFPISAGWRADTLWIWDGELGRFSSWDREGNFVRSINAVGGAGVAVLGDGSVLLAVRQTSGMGRLRPAASGRSLMHFVRWTPESGSRDTIANLEFRDASLFVGVGQGGLIMQQPFVSNPTFKAAPIGDAVFLIGEGKNSEPTVEIVALNALGDTIFTRHHPFVPTPVPEHTVDSTVAALVDRLTRTAAPQFGRPSISASAIRDDLEIPDYLPPVEAAAVDRSGGVWLKTRDTHGGWSVWHAVDSVGAHVGVILAPGGLQVLRVSGDQVWGAEMNELDVPSVVRYSISHSGAR